MIFHKYQECMRAKIFKRVIFHKYQQCTRTYFLGYMRGHHLENISDSVGFTYVLIFSKKRIVLKYQDSTTEKFFENARRYQSFWGVGDQKTFKKNRCLVGPELRNFRIF